MPAFLGRTLEHTSSTTCGLLGSRQAGSWVDWEGVGLWGEMATGRMIVMVAAVIVAKVAIGNRVVMVMVNGGGARVGDS